MLPVRPGGPRRLDLGFLMGAVDVGSPWAVVLGRA